MDAFHLIFPMELFKDFNKVFLKKKKKRPETKPANFSEARRRREMEVSLLWCPQFLDESMSGT